MKIMENGKKIKQIAAWLLVGLLSVSTFYTGSSIEAAGKKTVYAENLLVKEVTYTAFGDSIATGYGLSGYVAGDAASAQESYRVLVAQALQEQTAGYTVRQHVCAQDGMDSTVLLERLTDPENEYYNGYREAAAASDVITVSIGSNDILHPFMEEVAKALDCDIADISTKAEEIIQSGDMFLLLQMVNIVTELNKSLAGLSEDTSTDDAAKLIAAGDFSGNAKLNECCDQFKENIKLIAAKLRELAPNAVIYINNIYNPYRDARLINPLNDICVFDMANLSKFYIDQFNTAYKDITVDYTMIDVYSAFDACEVVPVNCNIRGSFGTDYTLDNYNVDPHPIAEGHAIIAGLIQNHLKDVSIKGRVCVLETGTEFQAGGFRFTVMAGGEVQIEGMDQSAKTVVIPDVVKVDDIKLKVSSIAKNAWNGDKKLVSLTIGSNIKTIYKKAFYGCNKLKKIKVTSKKVSKVKSKAFVKIHKKAVFIYPKKYKKKYKKLFE